MDKVGGCAASLLGAAALLLPPPLAVAAPAGRQVAQAMFAEGEFIEASAVLAGKRVVWVESSGDCDDLYPYEGCTPRIVASRGRHGRTLHRFGQPRQYRRSPFASDFLVTDLVASGTRVAYVRQDFGVDRGGFVPAAQEVGTLVAGASPLQLLYCAYTRARCVPDDDAGVAVDSDRVVLGREVRRGRSGLVIRDLSRRARRRRTFLPIAGCFGVQVRVAGRFIATTECEGSGTTISVYDWMTQRRVFRVGNREHQRMFAFDLARDGTLAVSSGRGLREHGRRFKSLGPVFAWASPRHPRLRRLPYRPRGRVFVGRDRIAFEGGQSVSRGPREFVVVDLRGNVVRRVTPRRRANHVTALADFDGRCLLWTQRPRLGRVPVPTRIFAAGVPRAGDCRALFG